MYWTLKKKMKLCASNETTYILKLYTPVSELTLILVIDKGAQCKIGIAHGNKNAANSAADTLVKRFSASQGPSVSRYVDGAQSSGLSPAPEVIAVQEAGTSSSTD